MSQVLPLKTGRLLLRDFLPEDFEALYATAQAPQYRKYYPEEELTRTHWEGIFERILASALAADRQNYQLAICLASGALIGTCGVRTEDARHRQASFGCAITQLYWGQGLALEASRLILAFGFANLDIHRIYAETNSENAKARRLAERLGMRLEGELRHNRYFRGRWWNTAVYSILADEWRADC